VYKVANRVFGKKRKKILRSKKITGSKPRHRLKKKKYCVSQKSEGESRFISKYNCGNWAQNIASIYKNDKNKKRTP